MEPSSSWILVEFVTAEPRGARPYGCFEVNPPLALNPRGKGGYAARHRISSRPALKLWPSMSWQLCYGNEQDAQEDASSPASPRTGPREKGWTRVEKALRNLFCVSSDLLPRRWTDHVRWMLWGCDWCPGPTLHPFPSSPSLSGRSRPGWSSLQHRPSASCPTAPPAGKSEEEAREVPGPPFWAPSPSPNPRQLSPSLLLNYLCPHKASGLMPV